ncbi:MAG: ion channel [Psychroserpens sp.]|uniref:ion channel n=1 Tax=Psychroserpens sp. TaxID=2020870 RepID=UPI0030024995
MLDKLYPYRFELFFATQLTVLFGSIIIPNALFENWMTPILLTGNLVFGVVLVSKNKYLFRFLLTFLIITALIVVVGMLDPDIDKNFDYLKLGSYFLFYVIVTWEIIKQVWKAKVIGKNVILGVISGYISLGFLAFFLCLTIEVIDPNSFSGLVGSGAANGDITEQLMYYSYITLMTIGYGDILPVTPIAQKAAMFIGLIGQFYLVIITAVVVGKYIQYNNNKD